MCQDGTYAPQAVQFWSQVRRRTSELLGHSADPDRDYVMTEIVHCRSKGEVGVTSAAALCAQRYLDRIVALSDARLIVVLGAKARDRFRPILRLGEVFGSQSAVGDERANVAIRDLGGARRVLCYLWHPTSMTKWPRDFPSSYPTLLPTLRAVALGELAVDRFSY
jgi:uracil-DNA glycosylase